MAAQPSTDLERQQTPAQLLVRQIRAEEFREQIRLALPPEISADRFVRATVTALMQNPDLAEADPQSLLQAVIRAAQDGLLPDGREAALVIFNTKVKTARGEQWVKKVQCLAMIGGLRKIAADHGWSLRTAVVREHDEFDFELGLEPRLVHQPPRPGADRGDRIAAYAVGSHKDGRKEFEVLSAEEVEKVRQVSRSKDVGPWKDWTDRMWEKTAGRRLFAKLPLADDDRVLRVIQADDLDPGDAAAALYGSRARAALSPVVSEAPAGRQQAEPSSGPTAGPSPDEEGSVPGGEPEPGPEPEPAAETTFAAPTGEAQQLQQAAKEAGATIIPAGNYKGETLTAVADRAPHWLKWALKNPTAASTEPIYDAITIYTRVMLPEVYQAAVGELEAQEPQA